MILDFFTFPMTFNKESFSWPEYWMVFKVLNIQSLNAGRVGVAQNMGWPSVGMTLFGLKGFPPGRSVVSILILNHHHHHTHPCHHRQIVDNDDD